jgi:hypothetical protein
MLDMEGVEVADLDELQASMLNMQGVAVSDMDELRAEIADAVEEMRSADPSGAKYWKGWRLEVTDGSGAVLLKFELDPVPP